MNQIGKSFFISLILFCAFFHQNGFAQEGCFNCNYDSLVKQLPLKSTDAEKIKLLTLLVDLYPEFPIQPPDVMMAYLEQLIALNKKSPVIDSHSYESMYESFVQWRNGSLDNALSNFSKTIDLFDQQKKIIINSLGEIRDLYNRLNRQEERLQYYKRKLDYYLLNGPAENTAPCYHGIAGYYFYKADYNLAITNYFRAAAVYKTFSQYKYNNDIGVIGVAYALWGNDEKADYYLKRALPLYKATGDSLNVSYCLTPLIVLNTRQQNYDQALRYADEAMQYADENANDPTYAIAVMQKAFVYLAMGKPLLAYPYLTEVKSLSDRFHFQLESVAGELETDFGFYEYHLLLNDPKNAITYLKAAYDEAVAENANLPQLKYLRELASFYQKQQPALAMQYIGKYFELNNAIDEANQKFKVAQYENEQKELEQTQSINALKQERAIQESRINQRNTIM